MYSRLSVYILHTCCTHTIHHIYTTDKTIYSSYIPYTQHMTYDIHYIKHTTFPCNIYTNTTYHMSHTYHVLCTHTHDTPIYTPHTYYTCRLHRNYMPHKGTFHVVCVKPHRYHIPNVTLPHATHAIPILHTDTKFHTSHTDTKHMTPPTHIKHSLCYLVTHK